jgi:predicted ATPase
MSEWHLGEIASSQANMDEAVSLAKELKDMHALACALHFAAFLAHYERNPTKVERLASEVNELSTRHHYAQWLAIGSILHGWARSAFGDATEGVSWIEGGIADYRATGALRGLSFVLALKAEALYLGNRIFEALEAIMEAEGLAERFEERLWRAELHRLRGVLLTAMGADEVEIEASFCAAIKTAREQKSISLEKRAEATYAEYRRQKASGSGGRGFRLPLC